MHCWYNRTPAGFRVGCIQSNFRYIRRLRRKIRELEIEARGLRQQLTMIMMDFHATMAENYDLRLYTQQIEDQMQLQDLLNGSVEEEIRTLRQMIQHQQAAREEFFRSVAYPSRIGANQEEELGQNQDVNAVQNHRNQEVGTEGLNSHENAGH
ncbi:unnamed protein product [Dovyalis caffra]|uniref:Uncharacterized protein n=1 Tax=Dovyalis caffra TaxID=77055 RepID=A0AAV1RXH0_9ROSI|nr:unnamed protein product [Dovyalis caffra]